MDSMGHLLVSFHGAGERPWLRSSFTVWESTPAPDGLDLATMLVVPTGFSVQAEELSDLVRVAHSHVQRVAVLPVNTEHERIVEELIASRRKRSGNRPLTRRV